MTSPQGYRFVALTRMAKRALALEESVGFAQSNRLN
jgi:hypothetical protein